MAMATNQPFLDPAAYEPELADPVALRAHRKRRLALAYGVFGAVGWGSLGDGHVSARDPERTDCFWLGRYGVPFKYMTTDDLVLVHPDGTIDGGSDRQQPVVAQDHRAGVSHGRRDALATVGVDDADFLVVEDLVIVEERA